MKLVYSRRSLRHLKAIYDYITPHNPEAANRTVQRIRTTVDRLTQLPYSGRPGPRGTRILSVSGLPYVAVYRVFNDQVRILAVFHTSRDTRL